MVVSLQSDEGYVLEPFTSYISDDSDSDYEPEDEDNDTDSSDKESDEDSEPSESSDENSSDDELPDLDLQDASRIELILFEKLSKIILKLIFKSNHSIIFKFL